ncbi:NitT/TauT family transport system ATP-binding protein [Actinocorallia herbida]|uniref:NitT/TauT family transport system ATP-binding protein n=1 Tax=Actinocorallia herbida TaxID=58109 RepID=A0A3N1CVN0_9ACTN|nr:ABC transporter ATP-binding protein [Actinocorallia herbida]ROO85351.1 NitT/TauT family transport system ATP-binding protein [Actinocorallia herbida]
MTGLALHLEDVTVTYGGKAVLTGLDLDVAPGEILAVTGASGCGKSTLLRVLAGLLPVAAGTVRADGEPVRGTSPDRALMFQDDALLPWRTARANVALPLAIRGVPRAERAVRADAWLARVGLAGLERRLPRDLSGGQRQRVQLARTLAGAPRTVLMDEPFGALDAQTRHGMQRLLAEVWDTGTTVVLVTHDVDEALLLGDRVAVLGEGGLTELVEVARPRTVVDPSLRARVLAALGAPTLETT